MNVFLKIAGILAFTAFLAAPDAALAQRYGHLNLGNLLEMMPEREAADQELAKLRDDGLAKGEEMIKVLDEKVKVYQEARQSGMLNQIQTAEREAELQKMNQEIVQYEQQLQNQLAQKRQELLGPILQKVDQAVKAVASENGFVMIFDTSITNGVLYAQDSEDVLPLVKSKLGI